MKYFPNIDISYVAFGGYFVKDHHYVKDSSVKVVNDKFNFKGSPKESYIYKDKSSYQEDELSLSDNGFDEEWTE